MSRTRIVPVGSQIEFLLYIYIYTKKIRIQMYFTQEMEIFSLLFKNNCAKRVFPYKAPFLFNILGPTNRRLKCTISDLGTHLKIYIRILFQTERTKNAYEDR